MPSPRSSPLDQPILAAVVLALGLVLGGWFIGRGFIQGRWSVRFVEVKGLAEREVTADLALWPLRYVSTGNDLTVAQAGLTRSTRQVFAFLTRHGIDTTAVQLQALEVSDADANRFPGERGGPRFVIQQTVIVRSRAPDVVMAASQRVSFRTALGGIRQASQGVFVILPRDQAPGVTESGQLQKVVRVVSTVQYILK
jgi:uncharacterized protein